MKKNIKIFLEVLSLAICVLILLTFLAGCKPAETTSNSSNTTSKEEEKKDMGNYKFRFLNLWGEENTIFNPIEGKDATNDVYFARNKKLMADYKFSVELIPQSLDTFDSYILSTALAGESPADIIHLEYSRMQSLRIAEVLAPFNKDTMPNINIEDEKWSKGVTKASTLGGATYGISNEMLYGSMCFFNATLFKEKNIPNPYELYKQDKWNWEEFKKLAKLSTVDENGDGNPDIYGVGAVDWVSFHFETPFIYANGGNAIKYDENGKARFAYTDNDAQESLNFLRELYNEKLVYPNLPTTDAGLVTMFSTRKAGFVFHNYGLVNQLKEMGDDFGVLPLPKGPSTNEYIAMSTQLPMFVTTITNVEKDKISYIFNLLTEPMKDTGVPEVDDEAYGLRNKVLRDDTAVEIVLAMRDHVVPCEPLGVTGIAGILFDAVKSCTRENTTTPKSAMESVSEQAQTIIDDFFIKKEE